MENPKITMLAICIIIIGTIPLIHGVVLISKESPDDSIEPNLNNPELIKPVSFTIDPKYKFLEFVPFRDIEMIFEKSDIFEGDVVKVTAIGNEVNDDVVLISLFVVDSAFDISELDSGKVLSNEREKLIKYNKVIDLFPTTDPPFQTTNEIPFLSPDQVAISGFFFTENSEQVIPIKQSIFPLTVNSQAEKLQIETNTALLAQIKETKLVQQEQKRTNNIFVGLSWLGVAMIPLFAGIDILLRVHLR